MPRTRLGISAGLLAAGVYFAAILGGYIPVLLIAGYILLFEQDGFLKRSAVKSVVFLFCYGILTLLIGFIPDIINWIDQLVYTLNLNSVSTTTVDSLFNVIQSAVTIAKNIFFFFLGINAVKGKDIKVPYVDGVLAKHL